MPDTPTPGAIAYAAYWPALGSPPPVPWARLSPVVHRAWEAAAEAGAQQAAPYEYFIRLLSCVHAVMRKRRTGDPSMPWETIDALCDHTLEAVMGDEAYQRWQHSTLPLGGTREETPHA